MFYEKIIDVEIDFGNSIQCGKLYIRFDGQTHLKFANTDASKWVLGNVYINLRTCGLHIEYNSSKYSDCLLGILKNAAPKIKIRFQHHIELGNNIIPLMETVFLRETNSTPYLIVELSCNYSGKEIVVTGDFSSALAKLKNELNDEIKICSFCRHSEFISYGEDIEDERHGWYCFRDLTSDYRTPWYERIHEFEDAIGNVSALHWCPRYEKR